MFITRQQLMKGVTELTKRCRFCREREYGHRKFIICSDQTRHNQTLEYGTNEGNNQHRPYYPKDQASFIADPFQREYTKYGLGSKKRWQGVPNWNKNGEKFQHHYNWTFNKHRQRK